MSEKFSCSFILRQQLKVLLAANRISARQLALQTKVPYTTVANWLEGRMPRNLDQLKRVALFFGLSVDALCYGTTSEVTLPQPLLIPLKEGFTGLFEVRLQKILKS